MENEFDIFKNFISKVVSVKQTNDCILKGVLVSVDGYLNMMLSDCVVLDQGEFIKYKFVYIRGSVVECLYF